jgi:hypothetical protein
LLQILRKNTQVFSVRFLEDCLGEIGIADEVLEAEKLAAEINCVTFLLGCTAS